ncbi:glycerol-3-phosphate 1-O-acyltransferase PlsY [Candidatus Margulisiibacteriota bacterium]
MLTLLAAYLIGSIPFGVIIGRLYKIDIRSVGSGNIGATNVFRNLGAIPGSIVFGLDVVKGVLPIHIAYMMIQPDSAFKYWIFILTGAFAVIGHIYPLYLRFKGGKGGATSLGVLIGLMPNIAVIAILTFMITLFLTRFVSVSTIITTIAATIAIWLMAKPTEYLTIGIVIILFIIYKHIPNIKRVIAGTEPKVGKK